MLNDKSCIDFLIDNKINRFEHDLNIEYNLVSLLCRRACYYDALEHAIQKMDKESLKSHLNYETKYIDAESKENINHELRDMSPLMQVIQGGFENEPRNFKEDLRKLKLLVDYGAEITDVELMRSGSPLFFAMLHKDQKADFEMIKYLCQNVRYEQFYTVHNKFGCSNEMTPY